MNDRDGRKTQLQHVLLSDYSTRILLGFLCSLGVLVIVLNLPLGTSPGDVAFRSSRAPQSIPVSEVEREKVSEGEEFSGEERTPPPTTQGSPVVDAQSGPSETDGSKSNDEGSSGREQASVKSSTRAVPVAELSSTDNKPEIIGGLGSLYLHIDYPYEARVQGIEGRLKLRFTITRDGSVRRIDVEKSLHPLCDSAAVAGVRSVHFRPAERGGESIPVRMTLPVRFELEPDTSGLRTNRQGSGEK